MVPSVTGAVKEAVEKYTGARILIVGPGLKTGLKMKVDDPAQQGSDLIVGAVAGVNLYPVPQILIDMEPPPPSPSSTGIRPISEK